MPESHPKLIYFIRPVGAVGPIKIGCSRWPGHRLDIYRQWSPVPLEIIATMIGDHALERRLHAQFYEHQTHHEWFAATPELVATVEAVKAGKFDPATLPKKGRNLYGPQRRAA